MADGVVENSTGKAGQFFQKHKTPILVVAGLGVAFVLYMLVRGSSGTSSQSPSAGAYGTGANPYGTGGPGSSYGDYGVQGPPGPPGATGKQGKQGKQGPPGKDNDRDGKKNNRHHKGGPPARHRHTAAHVTLGVKSPSPQTKLAMNTVHYTVKPGETSASVAMKHGTDISTLHGMNPAHVGSQASVHPGQRISVPKAPAHPAHQQIHRQAPRRREPTRK